MNVLIVEDEMMAQANLARALNPMHFPDVRIVGDRPGSVRETVLWLRTAGEQCRCDF